MRSTILVLASLVSILAVSGANAYPYVEWNGTMSAMHSSDLGGYGAQEAFDSHFGVLGWRADWDYVPGSAQGDAGFQMRNDGHGMWHGAAASDKVSPAGVNCREWIAADFGAVKSIAGADFWNINTYFNGRGIKDVSISISTDGENWTTAWTGIIARAPGTLGDLIYDGVTYVNPDDPTAVQYGHLYDTRALFAAPVDTQFVVINMMSHWDNAYGDYLAVDEVKFIAVPEPASLTLLGLGLGALLRKRSR